MGMGIILLLLKGQTAHLPRQYRSSLNTNPTHSRTPQRSATLEGSYSHD